MKIAIPQLKVEENDAFNNDQLNRKPFGEALYNLVKESSDDGLVISINAKWGEGKTTFIKMWQGLLKENNIHSIYIDAFKEDYIDDAFLSIASTIISYTKQNTETKDRVSSDLKKSACEVIKHVPWAFAKGVTRYYICDAVIQFIKDIISKTTSKRISDILDSHSESIKHIKTFQETLSELPSKLKNHKDESADKNNLVIIIDELDRCRPTFAIELIEKIKHMFSVKNIIFVLVMHKEQLEESIKCVYGNIDAHTYLQKFINLETSLPEKYSIDKGIDKRYITYIYDSLEIKMKAEDKESTIDFISYMAQHFKLSLRQIEQAFTNISILLTINEQIIISNKLLVAISLLLCILKVYDVALFKRCAARRYNNLIADLKITIDNNDYYYRRMRDCISAYTESDGKLKKLADTSADWHELLFYQPENTRLSVIPNICQQLSTFTINY